MTVLELDSDTELHCITELMNESSLICLQSTESQWRTNVAPKPDVKTCAARDTDQRILLLTENTSTESLSEEHKLAMESCDETCTAAQRIHWRELIPSSQGSAITASHDHVYIVGGLNNELNIRICSKVNDSYRILESVLRTPRFYAEASLIGNKLYVTGGMDDKGKVFTTTEVFDLDNDF